MDLTRQLEVLHFSDIHFGARHRFNPPVATGGDTPEEKGYPSLAEKLLEDLSGIDPGHPVIICCTGDFAETAAIEKFQAAEEFVKGLAEAPNRWGWRTIKVDDRQFLGGKTVPDALGLELSDFSNTEQNKSDRQRIGEYERTRGNVPVVSVMPSLVNGQAYEARLWIVPHGGQREEPIEVLWIAGKRFPVLRVTRERDSNFCARFNYWGPMLVQAKLIFEDGEEQLVHIYARMPQTYGD